jgi:hypothetical protein
MPEARYEVASWPAYDGAHMLTTGEAFRDLGESYLDRVARKRSTARLVQRLSKLGYDVTLMPRAA